MSNSAQLIQTLPNTKSDPFDFKSMLSLNKNLQTLFSLISCLILILAVSVYDSWLVIAFKQYILIDEQNPICHLLIRQDPSGLSWFIAGKTIGNLFVVSSLIALYRIGFKHTLSIASAVALFQICLLIYLEYSDSRTGFLYFNGLWSNDSIKYRESLTSLGLHLSGATAVAISGFVLRKSVLILAEPPQK